MNAIRKWINFDTIKKQISNEILAVCCMDGIRLRCGLEMIGFKCCSLDGLRDLGGLRDLRVGGVRLDL